MILYEEWRRVCKKIDIWEYTVKDENGVVIFREFVDKIPFTTMPEEKEVRR